MPPNQLTDRIFEIDSLPDTAMKSNRRIQEFWCHTKIARHNGLDFYGFVIHITFLNITSVNNKGV